VTDAKGTPLVTQTTAANVHDGSVMIGLIDAIGPIRGKRGAPRRRPHRAAGDKAYHSRSNLVRLWIRRIEPLLPRRGEPQPPGLGVLRWVVERTISWLHQFKRLRTRWERRADMHQGMLKLAASVICLRILLRPVLL
jgi:transposase